MDVICCHMVYPTLGGGDVCVQTPVSISASSLNTASLQSKSSVVEGPGTGLPGIGSSLRESSKILNIKMEKWKTNEISDENDDYLWQRIYSPDRKHVYHVIMVLTYACSLNKQISIVTENSTIFYIKILL